MSTTEKIQAPGSRPSRRTIVKGAAWAVPAIAVASATPAFAASQPIVPSWSPGTFCKHSNDKAYHAVFCFKNTTAADITVTLGSMSIGTESHQGYFSHLGASVISYVIPANTEKCLYVDSSDWSNMQNTTVTLSFSYISGGTPYTGSVTGGDGSAQGNTPCGTNPAQSQPSDKPPHPTDGP